MARPASATSAPAFTRFPDWEARLAAFMARPGTDMPFDMGRLSCAIWTADAVIAMTGRDPAETWRHLPADERGIILELRTRHGDLMAATTAALGPPVDPRMAQRGDVVLHLVSRGRQALGICIGRQFAALADNHIATRAMVHAIAAWRVG